MATEAPVYDLILLLDTTIEQERRDTILANVEDAIDRAGELVGRHDWGNRAHGLRGAQAVRGRLPPAPVPRPARAAGAAGPQPQDHGRHPPLPDHQAPAGHARRRRTCARPRWPPPVRRPSSKKNRPSARAGSPHARAPPSPRRLCNAFATGCKMTANKSSQHAAPRP